MRNKKAMISTPLVDFWAIVAFILIILLFYFIINASIENGSATMLIRANEISANAMLDSYLRTPVSVNGKEMQMSELIIESNYNQDYTKLSEESTKILEKLKTPVSGWNLQITFPNYDFNVKTYTVVSLKEPDSQATALLPTVEGKTIVVRIYKISQ